jgi:hypothetical protein
MYFFTDKVNLVKSLNSGNYFLRWIKPNKNLIIKNARITPTIPIIIYSIIFKSLGLIGVYVDVI